MESILTSIKQRLGPSGLYDHFDPDIVMEINTAFFSLTQLGVGPSEGFSISDESAVWTDFTPDISEVEAVKTYIYLKVKLVFDPPLNSAVLESMKETIRELEFRLNVAADNT